jgi:hypothetical protein
MVVCELCDNEVSRPRARLCANHSDIWFRTGWTVQSYIDCERARQQQAEPKYTIGTDLGKPSFRDCIVSIPIIGTIPAVPPMKQSQAVHGIARTASKPAEAMLTPCAECKAPLRKEQIGMRKNAKNYCAYCAIRGVADDKGPARGALDARIEAAPAPQPEPKRDAADWDVFYGVGFEDP